jgi:biotin carboxylase
VTRLNIFVLGLDELNQESLEALPGAEDYRFLPLLSVDELIESGQVNLAQLLDKAQRQLDEFDGSVDAIIGYWDFPVSSMVPMLCRARDLAGPSLEGVVKCEHKYWSRVEQRKVIEEHPRFAIVDLDQDHDVPSDLRFPMWLKPVKSASSELAFHVEDAEQFAEAVEEIREGIDRLGKPFEFVLDQLDLPPEIADVGGRACLAEEEVSGQQVTVEGYCYDGEARPYAIIDSVSYPDSTSFLRFQYPSTVPEAVAEKLVDVSRRVIDQIGLRWGTFNIEYFWDPETGDICLLEVNPRHSQSHAVLFQYVDGVTNHHFMVQLALGQEPEFPHQGGEYDVAAKWFLRRFEDGLVRRIPTEEEVERVEQEIPGVKIDIVPEEGTRLSDMDYQDSYSYELADIHIGAADESELKAKFEQCAEALRFEFDD